MKTAIHPHETSRAQAFSLWMSSPMPMVTLVKTIDVSRLLRYSRRHRLGFNLLLCWCIGKAATRIPEFYLLPEKDKMYRYDSLTVNVIVNNTQGGISSCDIPFSDDLLQFAADYLRLTHQAAQSCVSTCLEDRMTIGTSAMIATELDCVVGQSTDRFSNPGVLWGKYRKGWLKTTLPVSFQFHHVQMDGGHAARFLEQLQREVDGLRPHRLPFILQ